MKDFLQILKTITTENVMKLIHSICNAVSSVFGYLNTRQELKQEKEKLDKEKKEEENIKNVCDNGSLHDLINITEGVKK